MVKGRDAATRQERKTALLVVGWNESFRNEFPFESASMAMGCPAWLQGNRRQAKSFLSTLQNTLEGNGTNEEGILFENKDPRILKDFGVVFLKDVAVRALNS